jgi:prepilin-type N-terminal cleavage/methylation domain-containing protein
MQTINTRRVQPHGFTLVEVLIVSVLMAFLAMLLAETWSGLGRPFVEMSVRSRLASEASHARAALARDLGGCLSNNAGRIGGKLDAAFVGRLQPGGSQLWLCFDGGATPNGTADWAAPDTVISYEVDGTALVRRDQTAGTSFIVAQNVGSFIVEDLGAECQITLTFVYRNTSQTYLMIAQNP